MMSVFHGFGRQSSRAALVQQAATPGEKGLEKVDEQSNAPCAAAIGDVGPSMPSLCKEVSWYLVNALRGHSGLQLQHALLQERAGRGLAWGTALPCVIQD